MKKIFIAFFALALTFPLMSYEIESDFTRTPFWGEGCKTIWFYNDDGSLLGSQRECCKFRFWINFGSCDRDPFVYLVEQMQLN